MSQKFQSSIHHREDMGFVKLSGVIDEDNDLADLTDKIVGSMVVIELGEVERINSCGVRDWVNWLSALEARGAQIVLVKCSPAIVAQINLVNNFTGNGSVKSFYVPYFCSNCDEEKVLLCEAAEMGPPPHEPPVCRCDGCDLVMDFDDMPDSYFAFLSSQGKVAKSEHILSVLEEFDSVSHEPAKIRSRVAGVSGSISATSLPSVPSLPSITGIGSGISSGLNTGIGTGVGGSGVGSGVGSISQAIPRQDYAQAQAQGATQSSGLMSGMIPVQQPEEGTGIVVYVLVAVLLAAISVLGFLLLTGN